WGLELVAGRNLPAIPAEKEDRYVLINQKMVSELKYPSAQRAVGQHLLLEGRDVEIIGVVKDFQFTDLTMKLSPIMLRNRRPEFGYITVRVRGKDLAGAVSFMQDSWRRVNPGSKFEYEFFDEQVATLHAMMSDTAGVLGLLAFLAVTISCLGLLGMAAYTAETRRKEISIRKVLGSNAWQVLMMLSKGFLTLLGIAIVISVPAAILINNLWLQEFASRISISAGLILLNVAILLTLSFLIIVSQTWRVSTASPVTGLRME
ncbi:MAG TPA: FtsX-like permease family protein, partial [Puia sp.]|nr:FtsX-like permease family protein [Puia sp.]